MSATEKPAPKVRVYRAEPREAAKVLVQETIRAATEVAEKVKHGIAPPSDLAEVGSWGPATQPCA